MTHHPIISSFPLWEGVLEENFSWVTFTGSKVRHIFCKEYAVPREGRLVRSCYPQFDEEYFEWIDMLEMIAQAKNRFVMVELGAGYGRWILSAAKAIQRTRPEIDFFFIGVEAEETHFKWMKQHAVDNGFDLKHFRLIRAAAGGEAGYCHFPMSDPYGWYGQSKIGARSEYTGSSIYATPMIFLKRLTHKLGKEKLERIEQVSLSEVLQDINYVDFIDLDVQGSELEVLGSKMDLLRRKVKCVHIGTHSHENEIELRRIFTGANWIPVWDFEMGKESRTNFGQIFFQDGIQTWINPNTDMVLKYWE